MLIRNLSDEQNNALIDYVFNISAKSNLIYGVYLQIDIKESDGQLVNHVDEGGKYDGFTRTSCPGSVIYNMYTRKDINLQQQWLKKKSDSIRSKKNYTHGIYKGDTSQCIISLICNKYIMSHNIIWLML